MYTSAVQNGVLEVRHLQLVSAIVDEGNLTRAGRRLNLTQSALSHQLLDIEERLGVALFDRVNKRMVLTDAGQRVLESARRILEELGQTEDLLNLYATNRRGAVRLTTECYTVYHWLPTVMKKFEQKYPEIELRIEVDATDAPFEALAAGLLDVAFVTSDIAPHGIAMEPLFDDELKVIVHPGHPFAKLPYVKAAQLAGETLLTYSELKGNVMYERVLRPAGLEPKKHLQVRLTEAMIELVKAGVGVAVLAQWAVAPYVASRSVAAVPLTKHGLARHWKAAHVSARPMPPFVSAFIDMVAAQGPRALRMAPPLPVAK
jgi:LysR family transcriptional regulator, regulator for metE and metH